LQKDRRDSRQKRQRIHAFFDEPAVPPVDADESAAEEAALDQEAEDEWLAALASEVKNAGAKARAKRAAAAAKKAIAAKKSAAAAASGPEGR
jgi:predicted transcriptional regulator